MQTVLDILDELGIESVDEMKVNESHTISQEVFMDLTIEKVAEDRLSVMHSFTQNKDLMRDPEIVFDVAGNEWTPVVYQQSPNLYREDEDGLPDVGAFADTWDTTLRKQGFVEAASEQSDT
jgi:hypothetical protein